MRLEDLVDQQGDDGDEGQIYGALHDFVEYLRDHRGRFRAGFFGHCVWDRLLRTYAVETDDYREQENGEEEK